MQFMKRIKGNIICWNGLFVKKNADFWKICKLVFCVNFNIFQHLKLPYICWLHSNLLRVNHIIWGKMARFQNIWCKLIKGTCRKLRIPYCTLMTQIWLIFNAFLQDRIASYLFECTFGIYTNIAIKQFNYISIISGVYGIGK